MDRWDDLQLFLAVAREGTLAAAAVRVGLDPSTLHRRMATLEASVGAPLFERSPRGYALTPGGETLLARAEDVEAAVEAARRAVWGHQHAVEGRVRVTLPPTLLGPVAPHLASVWAEHPGLRLEVRTDPVPLQLGRDTDVAVRVAPAPPDEAVARQVATVRWAVYAGPGESGGWVAYTGMEGVVAARAQRGWVVDDLVIAEVCEVQAMADLLRRLPARGLLPCYLGDACPELRRLIDIPEAATPLWVLVHAAQRRSARVRSVSDGLVARLGADSRW